MNCVKSFCRQFIITKSFHLYEHLVTTCVVFNLVADEAATTTSVSPPPALISNQDDSLTNHPAKRNVMNYMKVLIVDALSLPASPKTQPVIDLVSCRDLNGWLVGVRIPAWKIFSPLIAFRVKLVFL